MSPKSKSEWESITKVATKWNLLFHPCQSLSLSSLIWWRRLQTLSVPSFPSRGRMMLSYLWITLAVWVNWNWGLWLLKHAASLIPVASTFAVFFQAVSWYAIWWPTSWHVYSPTWFTEQSEHARLFSHAFIAPKWKWSFDPMCHSDSFPFGRSTRCSWLEMVLDGTTCCHGFSNIRERYIYRTAEWTSNFEGWRSRCICQEPPASSKSIDRCWTRNNTNGSDFWWWRLRTYAQGKMISWQSGFGIIIRDHWSIGRRRRYAA